MGIRKKDIPNPRYSAFARGLSIPTNDRGYNIATHAVKTHRRMLENMGKNGVLNQSPSLPRKWESSLSF